MAFSFATEQLHQNVQIFMANIFTVQFTGTISTYCQFLLFVFAPTAINTSYIIVNTNHHSDTIDWSVGINGRQRCVR